MPDIYLGGEPFPTHLALEGSLLGVAPHVDLQGGVACKHFEAELAGGLTTGCKHIFHEWIYLGREKELKSTRHSQDMILSHGVRTDTYV